MPEKSAIEMLVFKPEDGIPFDKRGVHENLWIKQRFSQYLSVGVYVDESGLKYYFFEDFYKTRKTYDSLIELKQALPDDLADIFENTPKLFMMGHGRGDQYGLGNHPVEILDEDFDKIIMHFTAALPVSHPEVIVTLEACNTDNLEQAMRGEKDKTFLERISTKHPTLTFCGTGPWDPDDPQTGYRASGGFPTLHAPITSMGGGVWKHGNSVIFYHDGYQVAVIKSMFASTESAKALKMNTIAYAREVLTYSDNKEVILASICRRRDILHIADLEKIEELKNITSLHRSAVENPTTIVLMDNEAHLIAKEKNRYLERVQAILTRLASGLPLLDKDPFVIALGLKDLTVFTGQEDVLEKVFANHYLLQQVMISCGKVLVAGPSNENIIDRLLEHGASIHSADENGMTALHHAVQSFYLYRKEPLDLINQLIDRGANLHAKNNQGQTPLDLAMLHAQKSIVTADNLLVLLQQRQTQTMPASADTSDAKASLSQQSHLSQGQLLSSPPVYRSSSSRSGSYNPGLFPQGAPNLSVAKRDVFHESDTKPSDPRMTKEARRI